MRALRHCTVAFAVLSAVLAPSAGAAPRNGPILHRPLIVDECVYGGGESECADVEPAQPRLRLIRPDGRVIRRIPCSTPTRRCRDELVELSPRSGMLAVATKTHVSLMTLSGKIARRVAFAAAALEWSPDGRLLAAVGRPPKGEGRGLYVITAAARQARPIVIAGISGTPAFSPDGRRIAYTAFESFPSPQNPQNDRTRAFLNTVGVDARRPRGILRTSGYGRLDVAPGVTWSRRGRLLFSTEEDPLGDLYEARPPKKGARRLFRAARSPEFSPDGRRVIFSCERGLCVSRADGSDRRGLTSRCEFGYGWSPDGREVLCSVDIYYGTKLVRIDSRSGRLIKTIFGGGTHTSFYGWLPVRR